MSALWLPVLLPVAGAAVGYYLNRKLYRALLLALQLVQVALVTRLFAMVRAAGPLREAVIDWPAGVGIALYLDLPAAVLVLLTGWFYLFLLLFNYRKLYTDRLFYFLFVLLQGLLVGLFVSGDLFNVYVLLELSTLVVCILIMFKRDKQTLYDGMVYLMINLASMSFMLLGIGFVYRTLGTLDLAQMGAAVTAAASRAALILPFALIMTGIGVKSAMFLLFAWLPKAHGAPSAPSAVSAILSGLQVKAGVYLFLRLLEIFSPVLPIEPFFLVLGFLTAISGFVLAMAQKQIKLLLAYSTISQIGLIIVGLTSGTEIARLGALYHIVNHAFAKALLFLTAGLAIHVYGTKALEEIRGVLRRMPLVGTAAIAAILGMIGMPLFSGAASKYLIQGPWAGDPVQMGIYLVNLGTTVTFIKFASVLFGRPSEAAYREEIRQPDPFTSSVAVVMGLSCFAGGLFAGPLIGVFFGIEVSVAGVLGLDKWLTFFATLGAGFAFYRLAIVKVNLLDGLRSHQFYFNDLVIGMLLFFAATAGYLAWAVY